MGPTAQSLAATCLLAVAATAAAAPSLDGQVAADGRVTLVVAGATPGCTIQIHGHPKRRRAATGALVASTPAATVPRLLDALVGARARSNVHLAAVVTCPDVPDAVSAPVRIAARTVAARGRRLSGRAWIARLSAAFAERVAEREDAGLPSDKQRWHDVLVQGVQGSNDPQGAFAVDPQTDFVVADRVHGTEVVVAIAPDANPPVTRPELARRIADLFHHEWHVFGGFPLDQYLVKLRSPAETGTWVGFRGGLVVPDAEVQHPVFWEFLAHEMFHAWNGGVLQPDPDGSGNLFQRETWLVEGGTVYQSFRALAAVLGPAEFAEGMGYRYEAYGQRVGGPADLSVQALCDAIGAAPPGTSGDLEVMLYARGMLLAYLADQRLVARGTSLDAVLRRLYVSHGIDGLRWRQEDFEAALLAESAPEVVAEHAALLAGSGDLRPLVGPDFTLFVR
jgi:hypothetical protein